MFRFQNKCYFPPLLCSKDHRYTKDLEPNPTISSRFASGRPRTAPAARDSSIEEAGQKLKKARERLNLKYRDVEEASHIIARLHDNDEFIIALSRLSDIENRGTVPSIYRLYTLCAIYRLDLEEVLDWYGVRTAQLAADAGRIQIEKTHLVGIQPSQQTEVQTPLVLDPGLDAKRTTFLSRMIQKWGKLPLALLTGLDVRNQRYGYIGTEDWSMYPLIFPGSLVLIDESRQKIQNSGWSNEFDRPIYFFETREGYVFGWSTLNGDELIVQPHPASMCAPRFYDYPQQIDLIGQVTGVAMNLDQARRRRSRA